MECRFEINDLGIGRQASIYVTFELVHMKME